MMKRNVLTVVPAAATYEGPPAPIEYQDYLVDGHRLRDLLRVPAGMSPIDQETTLLCPAFPRGAVEQIDKLLLLGPADFEDGRIGVLLCPVCGDTGCGVVSAKITAAADTITWEEFGWQDGITDEPQPWLFMPQRFTFDRNEYLALMQQLRATSRNESPRSKRNSSPGVHP